MDTSNSQFGSDVQYNSLDRGTPAWAVKPGPDLIAPTTAASEDFEGVLWSTITFVSGDWTLDNTQSHSPTHSYRSKVITDNQTTSFFIQNTGLHPQISFWLRTDTEANADFFELFIDSVQVYSESGFNDWHQVFVQTNGGFNIEFRYAKDFSGSTGADACWVDDIALGAAGSPAHPLVYAPMHLSEDDELIVIEGRSDTASAPVQTSQGAVAATIIAANPERKGFTVQNTGLTVIKLAFGSTDPTQTAYHVALAACSVADDGLGGYYSDDTFIGDVRAISSAGGGTLVALEVS